MKTASAPLLEPRGLEQLESTTPLLARALKQTLQSSSLCALFLKPGASGTFVAEWAFQPAHRAAVWNGLTWDPALMPDLWELLRNVGYLELPAQTLRSTAPGKPSQHLARSAFGVAPNEWVLTIRSGTQESSDGILVLISTGSILKEVPGFVSALQPSHAPGKAAA